MPRSAQADPVLDLLLPNRCGGCGRPGHRWCSRCAAALESETGGAQPAPVSGGVGVGPVAVFRCPLPGLPAVQAAGVYGGVLRAALLAYKERGRRDLAVPLGAALARALARAQATVGAPLIPVGVPASRAGLRARSSDHVAGLLCAVPPPWTVPRGPGVPRLRWTRQIVDQTGLGTAARAGNLIGSLLLRVPRSGWPPGAGVLLVDDVITTGATLAEASRACQAAGVPVRAAAVLAVTRLRLRTSPIGARG